MLENIHWLGHASFKIMGEKVIYVDPYELQQDEPADLIFVTHEHFDHMSVGDIRKIQGPGTVIVTTEACARKLSGDVRVVKAGERLTVADVEIEVIPAYNVGKAFHPQSAGGVGFILTVNGMRIYHAGDTDFIPEMKDVRVDVALLPIGGKYTMNAEEAAQAANTIKPQVAVPMHWGAIIGGRRDVDRFRELCQVPVQVLEKE
ncbi:MAG: MBL fold metallo-hydrolase [Anaerolineae bacterium]|nr:MBL fold metallo-hydrolase [Anaerolineae bacterium]